MQKTVYCNKYTQSMFICTNDKDDTMNPICWVNGFSHHLLFGFKVKSKIQPLSTCSSCPAFFNLSRWIATNKMKYFSSQNHLATLLSGLSVPPVHLDAGIFFVFLTFWIYAIWNGANWMDDFVKIFGSDHRWKTKLHFGCVVDEVIDYIVKQSICKHESIYSCVSYISCSACHDANIFNFQ